MEAQEQENEYPQGIVKSSHDSDPLAAASHLLIRATFRWVQSFFPEAGSSQERRIGLATISDPRFLFLQKQFYTKEFTQ
jgi:hypothetical protein